LGGQKQGGGPRNKCSKKEPIGDGVAPNIDLRPKMPRIALKCVGGNGLPHNKGAFITPDLWGCSGYQKKKREEKQMKERAQKGGGDRKSGR